MKIASGQIERFLARRDACIQAVLVYGPDQGAVRERSNLIMRWAVDDLADPFRVSELNGQTLRGEPARLRDEWLARALTGGRRAIRIRDATDTLADGVRDLLDEAGGTDASLLVVEAGELGPRSSLRVLFERAENAAALPCYTDEPAAIARLVRQGLAAQGATIENDALAWVVDRLGVDRGATRFEIEKLGLFAGDGGRITLDDAVALSGDAAASTLDEIALGVGAGDGRSVDRLLARALNEGATPITILRSVARHFERLHAAGGAMAGGQSADAALSGLRPPIFFKARDAFRAQLRRWPPALAGAALARLIDAEVACKIGGAPDQAICGSVLLEIARRNMARGVANATGAR